MRRKLFTMIFFIILKVIIFSACDSEKVATLEDNLEKKVRENNELASKVSDIQQQLDLLTERLNETSANLDNCSLRISTLSTKNTELNDLVGNLDKEKKLLEQEKKDLETQKEQLESARRKLLSSIESTEEEKLKIQEELENQKKVIEKLKSINNDLAKRFETEIQEGDITITRIGDRLILEVSSKILFETGSAEVNAEGINVLGKVAEVVKDLDDKFIQIAGHTDNVPYVSKSNKTWTNWELASARAVNVLKLLQKDGVKPENMYAAAFGEYHPKADNNTAEGRALNRRIDIQILPKPLSLEEAKKLADKEEEGN